MFLDFVIVTTNDVGSEAQRYTNKIMADENLAIVTLDGNDLSAISESPDEIVRAFQREAQHAKARHSFTHEMNYVLIKFEYAPCG